MFCRKRYESWQRLRKYILLRDGYTCHYCLLKMEDPSIFSVDHIVPRAKGGSSNKKNLVASCVPCNAAKSDTEYRAFNLKRAA